VTLPLIEPSSAMRKLPLPEPEVLAGGTSSAPLSFTLVAPLPGIQSGIFSFISFICAQAASAKTATIAKHLAMLVFMINLLLLMERTEQ